MTDLYSNHFLAIEEIEVDGSNERKRFKEKKYYITCSDCGVIALLQIKPGSERMYQIRIEHRLNYLEEQVIKLCEKSTELINSLEKK